MGQSYDDESDNGSGDNLGNANMREVDSKNLLNYQTDSEGEDSDEDDLGVNLEK